MQQLLQVNLQVIDFTLLNDSNILRNDSTMEMHDQIDRDFSLTKEIRQDMKNF